jgi:ribosomal protein S18 acetylase RimI-like enzyme
MGESVPDRRQHSVIASNERAVRLWQACGFEVVGRLPNAFNHPRLGLVDALVMMRAL